MKEYTDTFTHTLYVVREVRLPSLAAAAAAGSYQNNNSNNDNNNNNNIEIYTLRNDTGLLVDRIDRFILNTVRYSNFMWGRGTRVSFSSRYFSTNSTAVLDT